MRSRISVFACAVLLIATSAWAQNMTLPSGSEISVRTDEAIKATSANAGHTYAATVSDDVKDANGNVAVPKGARAQLVLVQAPDNKDNVTLDLHSVSVNGQRYMVTAQPTTLSKGTQKSGIAGHYSRCYCRWRQRRGHRRDYWRRGWRRRTNPDQRQRD